MKTNSCRLPVLGLAIAAILTLLNALPCTASNPDTVLTYQGCIQDNGTNFTGVGLFKFAIVTSTNFNHQAVATAMLSGDSVGSYSLVTGGNGYLTAPAVHISGGGGSGAEAVAIVSGGVVTAINPVNGGSGYTNSPVVLIDPPPGDFSYTTFWSNDGASVAGSEPAAAVSLAVSNGMFLVALGDGAQPNMNGIDAALFLIPNLQLRIWFSDGVNGFAALSPLQNLATVPYSSFANTASNLLGVLPASQLTGTVSTAASFTGNLAGDVTGPQNATVVSRVGSQTTAMIVNGVSAANSARSANNQGTIVKRDSSGNFSAGTISATAFSGDGSGLTNVNAARVGGLAASNFWRLDGNSVSAGQFLGSTNLQAVDFRVNNVRAFRLEPTIDDANHTGIVNVVGGAAVNNMAPGVYGSVIAGGGANFYQDEQFSGGADPNTIAANFSFIGGGFMNIIETNSDGSFIGGGTWNTIHAEDPEQYRENSRFSFIGGGGGNSIQGTYSTIGGGLGNEIQSIARGSVIGGGEQNSIKRYAYNSVIGGGSGNHIQDNSQRCAIAGGWGNNIGTDSASAFLGGGEGNSIGALSEYAVLGGGEGNALDGNSPESFLGGGFHNFVTGYGGRSFLGGGIWNSIRGDTSVLVGGLENRIESMAYLSTIGGGYENTVTGRLGTIPGGSQNVAGEMSFAAGYQARATNAGAFVWSDGTGTPTFTTASNQFVARASGGFVFYTGTNNVGAQLSPGATAWSIASDRDQKKNIRPIDCSSVLEKLARVPVEQWNYRWEDSQSAPHFGPMAQDFKPVFYPGRDDKSISTLEFDGVELAAIQGLNEKLEAMKVENADLKARILQLETLVNKLLRTQE